jgi:hypothetical protein
VIALIGVPFLVIGLLAYTGVWRGWALGGLRYAAFAALWWGAGACLLGLAGVLPRGVAEVVGVLGILLTLIGAIALFWLPALLTPPWFRALRRSIPR